MRYLIISDTHLTDFFDQRKMKFLQRMIGKADQVIINGDFWETEKVSFDAFVKSRWSTELFPLLKEKHAVYLFGNHDPETDSDERTGLFSDQTGTMFEFRSGDTLFRCEHGHRYVPLEAGFSLLPDWLASLIHDTLVRLLTPSRMVWLLGSLNTKMIARSRPDLTQDQFLITGHTHVPEIRIPDRYANSGFSLASYCCCILIEDGVPQLLIERV